MKNLIRALVFACALCAAAPGIALAQHTATSTLTVEATDGALLLIGPVDALPAVQEFLARAAGQPRTAAQARAAIKAQFPDPAIAVTLFHMAGAAGRGVQRAEVPLRRALLRGLLPPVEGLPLDAARDVLAAAGFRFAARDTWDAMSRNEQLILAARATDPLVVLAGTAPQDAAIVIYVESSEETDTREAGK